MIDKVVCVDSGYLMHKAIFASMNNDKVSPTYMYLSMVLANLRLVGVDYDTQVIIAQDCGKSWRKLEDKTYKAQRKAGREQKKDSKWWDEKYKAFNDFIPMLSKAVSWQFMAVYGCEADDIASVTCRYYQDKEVVLVSSDADWKMLAAFDNVKIFSPLKKDYHDIKNPFKILLEKIQGDKSDNLLTKPQTEKEFELRKRIVDLIHLPEEIEKKIRVEFDKMLPKQMFLNKIPFPSLQERARKLYEE